MVFNEKPLHAFNPVGFMSREPFIRALPRWILDTWRASIDTTLNHPESLFGTTLWQQFRTFLGLPSEYRVMKNRSVRLQIEQSRRDAKFSAVDDALKHYRKRNK